MTLLVLRVIHVLHIRRYLCLATYVYMYMYIHVYMYDSTSTEGHTCSAHMTILILSNICVHVYVHTCIYV